MDSSRIAKAAALAALAPDQRGFLVIGAALIAGCFFAIDNVSYRGIHMLFIVPGMVALAAAPVASASRAVFRATAVLTLLVLWGLSLQQLVAGLFGGTGYPMSGSVAIYVYWAASQLAWWWIVSVLIAVLCCFGVQSTVWRTLTDAMRGR